MMTPELSHRLGRALGQHQVTLAERATVVDAVHDAEVWADLSPAVQALVEDIEGRPGPLAGSSVRRAAGRDVTPGHDELHHYWVAGPGLAKWAESPKPWTTLVALLSEIPEVGPEKAKVYASRWFIEHFGFAAGSDMNRVTHGQPPRGKRIGPG